MGDTIGDILDEEYSSYRVEFVYIYRTPLMMETISTSIYSSNHSLILSGGAFFLQISNCYSIGVYGYSVGVDWLYR